MTIASLQGYVKQSSLSLNEIRYAIGENKKYQPSWTYIYKDYTGEYVVAWNERSGAVVEKYRGHNEEYACQIFQDMLEHELDRRRHADSLPDTFVRVIVKPILVFSLSYVIFFAMFLLAVWFFFSSSTEGIRKELTWLFKPVDGYYQFDITDKDYCGYDYYDYDNKDDYEGYPYIWYYYSRGRWYYYDINIGAWCRDYNVKYSNSYAKSHYFGDTYLKNYSEYYSDFKNSVYH